MTQLKVYKLYLIKQKKNLGGGGKQISTAGRNVTLADGEGYTKTRNLQQSPT